MSATITDLANGLSADTTESQTGGTVTGQNGDWLVALVSASNDGSSGASAFGSVRIDTPSPVTFTERAEINYDPGAAGAGATLAICTHPLTSTVTNENCTAIFNALTSQIAWQVYRVRPGASETVSFIAADTTGSTGNATSHSAPTVSVTIGDMIFGAAAIETDDAVTGDTDTTNGNWSTVITRLQDSGADASCMSCASQHKTVNATGNQSWACTTASGRDSARTYIILRSEVTAAVLAADPATITITGSSITPDVKLLASPATITITPSSITPDVKLLASPATIDITGSAAALTAQRRLAADPASVVITGIDAILAKGQLILASPASMAIDGIAANLQAARRIAADPASIAITAGTVILDVKLLAEPATMAITGSAAALKVDRRLAADPASIVITGIAAGLIDARKIAAAPASIVITGIDATLTLVTAKIIAADPATIAISPSNAALQAARRLAADPGVMVITGIDATLTVGGGAPAPAAGRTPVLPVNPGSLMTRK